MDINESNVNVYITDIPSLCLNEVPELTNEDEVENILFHDESNDSMLEFMDFIHKTMIKYAKNPAFGVVVFVFCFLMFSFFMYYSIDTSIHKPVLSFGTVTGNRVILRSVPSLLPSSNTWPQQNFLYRNYTVEILGELQVPENEIQIKIIEKVTSNDT